MKILLIGASGLVGQEFLRIIGEDEKKFSHLDITCAGRESSLYDIIEVSGKRYPLVPLTKESLETVDYDLCFFSVPKEVTRAFAPYVVTRNKRLLDDSNLFRMDKDVPLLVAGINTKTLDDAVPPPSIMAIPNCTVLPLIYVLYPLNKQYGLKRVVVSTYQSYSGAGRDELRELVQESDRFIKKILHGDLFFTPQYSKEMSDLYRAFHLLPMIGSLHMEDTYADSEEELKIIQETKKILGISTPITATTVRVPTCFGHGLSVHVELEKPFSSLVDIKKYIKSPYVTLDEEVKDIVGNHAIRGDDTVHVARLREDRELAKGKGLNFWLMVDNIRRGAALNALECIDYMVAQPSFS